MRFLPRGLRARAVIVTAAATLVVAVILGLTSALLVSSAASNYVSEVVHSHLDDVQNQIAESGAETGSTVVLEAVEADSPVYVSLTDASGVVLGATPGMPAGIDPCAPGSGYAFQRREITVHGKKRVLCGAASLISAERGRESLARLLLIIGPIAIVGVTVAVWFAIGRALHSVEYLRRQAQRMSSTSEGTLVVQPTGDEIERLGRTLNDMLVRLHAQSRATRQFVADAGHELRNPLATLRVALELDEEPGQEPSLALSELNRLEALVQDLLVLARTDAQESPEFQDVDLAGIVADSVRGIASGDTSVHVILPEGPVIVRGDERSLRSAVDNLVRNALRHRTAQVDVSVSTHDDEAVLRVDDDGAGVGAADTELIFERFVRLDESRVRDAGGSGLGLAIVRATAVAHGGTVHAEPGPGGHFILELPLHSSTRGAGY